MLSVGRGRGRTIPSWMAKRDSSNGAPEPTIAVETRGGDDKKQSWTTDRRWEEMNPLLSSEPNSQQTYLNPSLSTSRVDHRRYEPYDEVSSRLNPSQPYCESSHKSTKMDENEWSENRQGGRSDQRSGSISNSDFKLLIVDSIANRNNIMATSQPRLIWYRLLDSSTGQPFLGTTADFVQLDSSTAVIAQFRDAVKTKNTSILTAIVASQLLIYPNKSAFEKRNSANDKAQPLKVSSSLNSRGESEDDALIVVVPTGISIKEYGTTDISTDMFGGSDPFGGMFGNASRGAGGPSVQFSSNMGGKRKATAAEPPRRYDAIPPGTVVSFKGLTKTSELNGDRGVIKEYVPESGRYVVELEDSDDTMTHFKQHDELLTRWVPPQLLNKRTTHDTPPASGDKTNSTVHVLTPTTNGDLKAAKRALSVAYRNLKAAKKQKKLNQNSSN